MTKSEENKLDQLHDNLLDIENHAKSLNLNKNDNHRYILTDIVNITESQKREKLPSAQGSQRRGRVRVLLQK